MASLAGIFAALAVAFIFDLWGNPPVLPEIPLVDTAFLSTDTNRKSYADLVAANDEDALMDYECYVCHDEGKVTELRYDKNGRIVVPEEHKDIVMRHGSHGRNNNCYNCHNEQNLLTLQPRDGRKLGFADSSQLCGSCHGPIFQDWEVGVHGRINGYWDTDLGKSDRKDCVNCHNPHSPHPPGRQPAPGPHPLREPFPSEHRGGHSS